MHESAIFFTVLYLQAVDESYAIYCDHIMTAILQTLRRHPEPESKKRLSNQKHFSKQNGVYSKH